MLNNLVSSWKAKPSWYIVAKNDRTVQPELERFLAKRMGATTVEMESSHVPMLSKPDRVLEVIRSAANAVQKARRHRPRTAVRRALLPRG